MGGAEELLSTRDGSAAELIGRAQQLLGEAEKLDGSLEPHRQRLLAAQAELDEAARGLSRYLSALESDPQRLAEVDDWLDALRRLCRKHAAPLEGVLARREQLAQELDQLQHRAERRAEVDAERARALDEATALAAKVTRARGEAARRLVAAVQGGLERLAMGKARFEVGLSPRRWGPPAPTRCSSCSRPTPARRRGRWRGSPPAARPRG